LKIVPKGESDPREFIKTNFLSAATAMKSRERGSPQYDELRQLLLERRQQAKLTQRELAGRLGWDQKIISKPESGSKRLTVLELIEIARALQFDPAAAIRRVMRTKG
jgi:DNA-binding XRE family transcriptional regulator